MSTVKKIAFIVLLVVFVGASVWLTFNTISRPTYEFEEMTDVADTDIDGWAFVGFNGNSNTKTVNVDFVRDENGENPQKDKPIVAVDAFTLVSDEYVQYINIGKDVEYIDEQAFFYCKQLRAVYVDDENPYYTDVDGVLYTKDMKTMLLYPICRCTQIVYDDIEKSGKVTNIGMDVKEKFTAEGEDKDALYLDFKEKASDDISSELFDEMLERGVTAPYIGTYYVITQQSEGSITVEKSWSCDEVYAIPDGVERIAQNCFYKCDRLQEIDIPSTVKEIGNMAFFKCFGISLVTLPDGLEIIGDDAFSYCQNMRYSIYIPASVKSIGHHAFYKSDALEKFFVASSEDKISLGGSWQPKGDNDFKAEPAIFSASENQQTAYNEFRDSGLSPEDATAKVEEYLVKYEEYKKSGLDAQTASETAYEYLLKMNEFIAAGDSDADAEKKTQAYLDEFTQCRESGLGVEDSRWHVVKYGEYTEAGLTPDEAEAKIDEFLVKYNEYRDEKLSTVDAARKAQSYIDKYADFISAGLDETMADENTVEYIEKFGWYTGSGLDEAAANEKLEIYLAKYNELRAEGEIPDEAAAQADEYTEKTYVPPEKELGFFDKIKKWIDSFKSEDGTNYVVAYLLILLVFVPGFIYIVLEVIRKMFKEDFLMTKKKKAKLKRKQEAAEEARRKYLEQPEKEHEEKGGDE